MFIFLFSGHIIHCTFNQNSIDFLVIYIHFSFLKGHKGDVGEQGKRGKDGKKVIAYKIVVFRISNLFFRFQKSFL